MAKPEPKSKLRMKMCNNIENELDEYLRSSMWTTIKDLRAQLVRGGRDSRHATEEWILHVAERSSRYDVFEQNSLSNT